MDGIIEDLLNQFRNFLSETGRLRIQFSQKAFRSIPEGRKCRRILDAGCGRGAPTLELARLCDGEVFGVDIDPKALKVLKEKARRLGLSNRIHAICGSMVELDFPDGFFDIIWSEGAIQSIGFKTGLNYWKRFLAAEGFLVVHVMAWLQENPPKEITGRWTRIFPEIATVPEFCDISSQCGYRVIDHIALPKDVWLHDYFGPLEQRIATLRKRYAEQPDMMNTLDSEQRDIDLYKRNAAFYGSAFFILQK